MSLWNLAKGVAASSVAAASLAAGLLYYGQNYLIYPSSFPPGSRTEVASPADHGMLYEDLTLNTSDGINIKAFLLVQRKYLPGVPRKNEDRTVDLAELDRQYASKRPTVMMFHGNGGNIGHRIPLARVFYRMRCNVLMLSYRGYGHSEGYPSESGFDIDSQTALDFLLSHPTLSSTPIVLYGQSIGGAVAISLASRNIQSGSVSLHIQRSNSNIVIQIRALILENTFLSLPRLIPSAIPFLAPVAFLCHQIWDSANAITLIPPDTPILMLCSMQDQVVPREHMVGLWEIATSTSTPQDIPQPPDPQQLAAEAKLPPQNINEAEATLPPQDKEVGEGEGLGGQSKENEAEATLPPKTLGEFEGESKENEDKSRIWREFPKGEHNDACIQPGYWLAISDFLERFN